MLLKSTLRIVLFLVSYVMLIGNLSGQNMQADSLLKLIDHQNHDSINGNIYHELAKTYYLSDTKNALIWAREGTKYFKKISSLPKMTKCMNLEAVCLLILDQPDESIKLHYTILKIREGLNDPELIAESLINIGNIFYRGQDKEQAIQFYLKAQKLALKKNNERLLATIANNLGSYYNDKYTELKNKKDLHLAIKYTKEAIRRKENLKVDKNIENSYIILAQLYYDSGDLKTAYTYAIKGEKLALLRKNDEAVASSKLLVSKLAIANKNLEEAQTKIDELYIYITNNKAFHILNIHDEDIVTLRNKIRLANRNIIAGADSTKTNDYSSLLIARQKIREEMKIKYDTERKELDNANLLLKNKIEQDKAEKNKIISIISLLFTIILLLLILNLIKKNRAIVKSETSIQVQAAQLGAQNILLKQSETFKAKLFSIISHDLKSPISSLRSIVELSTEVTLTASQHTFLMNEIKQELDTTSNLLNTSLFWSKAQMKSNAIIWSWFTIHAIVARCISTLQTNIKGKQLSIELTIPKETKIWGDEIRCEFIVRNIVHNAIKYSHFNQKIEIVLQETGEVIAIYVKDKGKGIPKEKVEKMFVEDYSRKSTKGTNEEQGAGIGLLLCNDFAESLGWSLQVESTINEGTTMRILIKKKNTEIRETSSPLSA